MKKRPRRSKPRPRTRRKAKPQERQRPLRCLNVHMALNADGSIRPFYDVKFCQLYIGGEFAGVKLPKRVPFFDCRSPQGNEGTVRSPYGDIMWADERAAYALGLRPSRQENYATTPISTRIPADMRTCTPAVLADAIRSLRKTLADQLKGYHRAKRRPARPGKGGVVFYRPVAVTLGNFGTAVLADTRTAVTAPAFGW